MAIFKDTGGGHMPLNWGGSPLFDADLVNWGKGDGPEISVSIPMHFESGVDGSETTYNSGGVIVLPIQELLDEYILNGNEIDGFNCANEFSYWLRDYAERLDAAIANQELSLS